MDNAKHTFCDKIEIKNVLPGHGTLGTLTVQDAPVSETACREVQVSYRVSADNDCLCTSLPSKGREVEKDEEKTIIRAD